MALKYGFSCSLTETVKKCRAKEEGKGAECGWATRSRFWAKVQTHRQPK